MRTERTDFVRFQDAERKNRALWAQVLLSHLFVRNLYVNNVPNTIPPLSGAKFRG